MTVVTSQLPLFSAVRQARRRDPETSKANRSLSLQDRAAEIVAQVMADGNPRIDEEIARDAGECGITADRLRHGRLVLVEMGRLEPTGARRVTSSGGKSREWRAVK